MFGKTLDSEISKGNEVSPNWYDLSKEMPLSDDIICNKDLIDGYRNKVEFSVGREYAPPVGGSVNPDG